MLIDSLSIQQSAAVGMQAGTPAHPLIDQADVINRLHDLLVGVGWSAVGLKTTADITYPLGFPTVAGTTVLPKRSVGCGFAFVRLDGVNYVSYDPFTEQPITGGECQFFALGTTAAAGLDNLVSALSTSVRFVASWGLNSASQAVVTITAIRPGPDPNFAELLGDGRWGVAAELAGGGYEFTSAAESHTSQFSVQVTSAGSINPDSRHITKPIIFDFQTSFSVYGSTICYLDTTISISFRAEDGTRGLGAAGYVIVANPYSFAVYVPDDNAATAIFATAPYIPSDFEAAYALLVIYPLLGGSTSWTRAIVCLDGAPQAYSGNAYPRMLAVRSPGTTPLKAPSGSTLISNAWVMFGRNASDEPAVVGRLWDCAMVSDVVNGGTVIAGKRYLTVASQDGSAGKTRSSLVFRVQN